MFAQIFSIAPSPNRAYLAMVLRTFAQILAPLGTSDMRQTLSEIVLRCNVEFLQNYIRV